MRIAVLGVQGQLGTALAACLGGEVVPVSRRDADITDAAQINSALDRARPRAVINAAAYNLVDRAEDEPELAYRVNALGPRNVALWCARHEVPLVHVSTDYVFGRDPARISPYAETDAPGPLGAYAISKLAGEAFVRSICPHHFVVRTCGLYGIASSPTKGNFVETMLRLGAERGKVSVVDDQWCTPTLADDLAWWITDLIQTSEYGLYHATNAGATTWCRFAVEIFRLAQMKVTVTPITTAQYGARARRPAFSVLDSSRLARVIGNEIVPWKQALAQYLARRANVVS